MSGQQNQLLEDNDSLMRSLPELSRETGIPMPVILRLKREHPDEIPSIGSGSQQFFPEGVIPVLRQLYLAEESGAPAVEKIRPLHSLARGRRQDSQPPPVAPKPPDVEAGWTGNNDRDGREDAALGARLGALEQKQLVLARELRQVLEELNEPWFAEFEAPLEL